MIVGCLLRPLFFFGLFAIPIQISCCFAFTVQLSLNETTYGPGDRVVLTADVELAQDTMVGPTYLYVRLPYTNGYSKLYLPLEDNTDPEHSPFLGAIYLRKGNYTFTLLEGEISAVLPMASGLGRYETGIEEWDYGYKVLDTVAFDYRTGYPLLYSFYNPPTHYFFSAPDGALWVATGDWQQVGPNDCIYHEGELYLLEDEQNRSIEIDQHPGSRHYVIDVAADARENVWFLTGQAQDVLGEDQLSENRGLDHLTGRTFRRWEQGELAEYPQIAEALPGHPYCMRSAPDGSIWILVVRSVGSDEQPDCDYLVRWDGDLSADSLQFYSLEGSPVPDAYGTRMVMGPDGCVYVLYSREAWLGLYDGVVFWEGNGWGAYNEANSPIQSRLWYFQVDTRNTKWFRTRFEGLLSLDGEQWTSYAYPESHGPLGFISGIARDDATATYYMTSYWYESASRVGWLSPDGEWASFTGPGTSECFARGDARLSTIHKDPTGIWWVGIDKTYTLASFDHVQLSLWDIDQWVHGFRWTMTPEWGAHEFTYDSIGRGPRRFLTDANGRTICATAKSLIVW